MQPVMREAPGEEVGGQHWLVAHAAQILLMVVSTFIYTLCKRVVDEFANSVVLWIKDFVQPPSPTPPVDLVKPDPSPTPTPPVDLVKLDPSSSTPTPLVDLAKRDPSSSTPTVDSAASDSSPSSTQPATVPSPTPPVDSATIAGVSRPPSVVPRAAPPPSRDTPTTLHRSLKYATDLAHTPAGARWNPTPSKRAIVETGIKHLAGRAHKSYPVLFESESEPEEDDDDESPGSESDDDEPLTWADKIEWALKQRGGEATLSEIYCATKVGFPEDIADKPNWQSAIRSCLSTNTRKGCRFAVEDSPDGRRFRLSAKARPGSHN